MDHRFFRQLLRFGIVAAVTVFFFAHDHVFAQGPPMSHSEQILQMSSDECVRRASRAFRQEGFSPNEQGSNTIFATKFNHSAYILCVPEQRNRTRVIFVAASRSGGEGVPGAELSKLQRRMERGGSGSGGGCGLGRRITEYENNFTGIWTRRGRSNVFDAVWTRGSERGEAILDISLSGNRITVRRTDTAEFGGNVCNYTGTLDSDGTTITGTYSCRTGERNIPWEATIECN